MMYRFYKPFTPSQKAVESLRNVMTTSIPVPALKAEYCLYVDSSEELSEKELVLLRVLLGDGFYAGGFGQHMPELGNERFVVELGPRLNFETAWSTNAVAICHACGLTKIRRIERSRYFILPCDLTTAQIERFITPLHDRMTEQHYNAPLTTFEIFNEPEAVHSVGILEFGEVTLRSYNKSLGLSFDEQDIAFYMHLFQKVLKRDPTNVELFQLGQANSEHCRHHCFKGKWVIDGKEMPESLMEIVQAPYKANPNNSVIAFYDNSSAIRATGSIRVLVPRQAGQPSELVNSGFLTLHPTLTAETHNHPSGVEPREGGATGTGGRLRDGETPGRGGIVIAGGAGYCVGNLHIPGYELPWEQDGRQHPAHLASPLEILIQASNGPSDYGNCFGEPVIYGFTRSFGQMLPDGYRSWFKPIMYSVGTGLVDSRHVEKQKPQMGTLLIQLGGPAYRIGLGGGAASSMISGGNTAELDFASVQRGNPQMENRMDRAIRACILMGEENPILSAHDLGAGGSCNALTELVLPAGARINLRALPVGDSSLSVLEIWGNESQERNAILIWPDKLEVLARICERENCPMAVAGEITGDGRLVVYDEKDNTTPVDLPLNEVLGNLPRKQFRDKRVAIELAPLTLPEGLTVKDALDRVLRLPSVCSKQFLTNKVDRSVGGLVAQQQCVGPLHLPIADFAAVAHSHFWLSGTALSLGEQPIKGLVSPITMARLAVAEALLNMAGAVISGVTDIRCSANWMWAAKLPGEGANLYDAACSLRDIMLQTGMAIDGGKDSLSMAAKTKGPDGRDYVVKAPGELVIAMYACMPDIRKKVTPDLKSYGDVLYLLDLSGGKNRLGGSALAQCYGQIGNEVPDIEDGNLLLRTFQAVQELVSQEIITACHDRSDGGLITTLLEMACAGNFGLSIALESSDDAISALFSEESGLVIAGRLDAQRSIIKVLNNYKIPYQRIGETTSRYESVVKIQHNNQTVLEESLDRLRNTWQETSYKIEALQANPGCIDEERKNREVARSPQYFLSFAPRHSEKHSVGLPKQKVAVIRGEGTNGDSEMAAAFYKAGFEVWDVHMSDLLSVKTDLSGFRGVAFPGGFTYMDVFDAAKGWASLIRLNPKLHEMFTHFYSRDDTFSLGICNGCQLMALLGWVPGLNLSDDQQPRFVRNNSGRFESRFPTVRILESRAIMLSRMAGSQLGVWVNHGEGRLQLPAPGLLSQVRQAKQICMEFVSAGGESQYSFNPNGSPEGITALCSPDGRHLAMMPHPERLFELWQWPWTPREWKQLDTSPWFRMFQNAYTWCLETT